MAGFFRTGSGDSFSRECLESMNKYRAQHQVSPLSLNSQISEVSQRWADRMARDGNFRHNPSAAFKGQQLGENIAMKWNSDRRQYPGGEIIEMWYSEVKNYNFRSNSGPNTGHFTQLVWKDSKEVGIGKAVGSDGKFYVVANFSPPGNFLGRFGENVFPTKDGKAISESKPSSAPKNSQPESSLYSRASPAAAFPSANWNSNQRTSPRPTEVDQSRQVSKFPSSNWTNSAGSCTESQNAAYSRREVFQETSGKGPNAVTKNIVIETYKNPDGSTRTVRHETVSSGDQPTTQTGPSKVDKFSFLRIGNDRDSSHQVTRVSPTPFSDKKSNQSGATVVSSGSPWGKTVVVEVSPGATAYNTTSSSPSSSSSRQSSREFIDEIVRCHNNYRRKHGRVGDLVVNRELCDTAQRWAERLVNDRVLQHSKSKFKGQPVGENIACKSGNYRVDFTGEEVVDDWYSEIKKYDFRNMDRNDFRTTGHFSQVVWKGSKEIGVGKAVSSDGGNIVVVCNYFPAGNVVGTYKEHVFPA